MADYANLKNSIRNAIKANGNNEITGNLLQQVFVAMVSNLGAAFQFAGVATQSTNPGTPDYNVAYLAGPGTYQNMGGSVVPSGYIGVIAYNGSWGVQLISVGSGGSGSVVTFNSLPNGATQILVDGVPQATIPSQYTLLKLSAFTTTPDGIANGAFYYNTSDKKIYQKRDSTVAVIPYYDGAIYTYNNALYIWNGTDLINVAGGGGGGVDFLTEPDDLTLVPAAQQSDPSVLKFADRAYNSQQPNGMGYKILRKDATFVSQVTDTNTIYEIRYDFALAADFTMPANCVLRFNGGSISGAYTLTGQDTKIDATVTKIFGTDITISGTWSVPFAFPEWFGAIGDGVTDDRAAFQKCIDSFRTTCVRDGSYLMASMTDTVNRVCLVMPEKHEICATNNMLTSRPMIMANCSPNIVIQVQTRCIVKGLSIDGGNEFNQDFSNLTYKTVGIGSGSAWAAGLEINDCFIYKCYYGMDLKTYLSVIHHNSVLSCYIGFYIHGDGLSTPESVPSSRGTSTSITNNYANKCQSYGYAIIGMAYSKISTNACDSCGYNTFSSAFSHAYRFAYLRTCTIQSNGMEGGIFAYYLSAFENVTMISCSAALTKIDGYSSSGLYPIIMGALHATEIRGLWFITDNTFASGEIDSLKFINKSASADSFSAYEIRVNGSMLTASQIQMTKYSDSSCLKYYTPRLGETSARPTGMDYRVALGTTYYDTDLQRFLIYANGWKTTEGDNASFKTSGTTSERPVANAIRIGFMYFDTTLGKPIWAKSVSGYTIEWVDATGAAV